MERKSLPGLQIGWRTGGQPGRITSGGARGIFALRRGDVVPNLQWATRGICDSREEPRTGALRTCGPESQRVLPIASRYIW